MSVSKNLNYFPNIKYVLSVFVDCGKNLFIIFFFMIFFYKYLLGI